MTVVTRGARVPIRRLDQATAAGIRAGEVVERPVSALKEILENALDAGASRIEITVRGGLEGEFQVSDDGVGIPREDLPLAIESHATSKLRDLSDLESLVTLGFRGEALAAVARVSRLVIETRARDEDEGSHLESEAGEPASLAPLGRASGTTVVVRELFYNAPARRKFLRSSIGELRAAARLISAYAAAYPEIAFRFTVDGRERFQAAQATSMSDRMAAVFGRRFLEQCLHVEEERPGLRLEAFLGVPELARVSREAQIFLVNRRWVQSQLLSQAVRHAYGNLLPPGRHPACVVDLRIDPASLDVNVHPTKREVRFSHDDQLFSFVSRSAAQPLSRLTPRYEAGRPGAPAGASGAGASGAGTSGTASPSPPSLEDLVRDRGPQTSLWSSSPWSASQAPPLSALPRVSERVGPAETRAEAGDIPRDITPSGLPTDASASSASTSSAHAPSRPTPVLANLWQLHETYILAPVSGGLVIIDQHAAHERVLYEEALDRMRGASGTSQLFLIPLLVDLTRAEFELVLELMEPLSRLGFDLAPISPPSVLVRGAPSGRAGRDPGQLLRDLLDGMGEDRGRPLPDDELADRLAKSYACHAAVRAGEPLTIEEMNRLVDKLFATSLPHGDPHGRPSFVRVDLRELGQRFGRSSP
jgi:DNA mismatch repair protein MutL